MKKIHYTDPLKYYEYYKKYTAFWSKCRYLLTILMSKPWLGCSLKKKKKTRRFALEKAHLLQIDQEDSLVCERMAMVSSRI